VINFLKFILIVYLLTNVAYFIGLTLSCAIWNSTIVVRVQPLILIPSMVFSGFFINLDSIPGWLRWLQHVSFFKYGFGGAVRAAFGGENFCCEEDQFVLNSNVTIGNVTAMEEAVIRQACDPDDINATAFLGGRCPITRGEQVLERYSFSGSDILVDCVVLVGFIVGLNIIALIALRLKK